MDLINEGAGRAEQQADLTKEIREIALMLPRELSDAIILGLRST